MNDLVHSITSSQVDQQVAQDKSESLPHRVIEMVDATVATIFDGPQDRTISSNTAQEVVEGKPGLKKDAAEALQTALNAVQDNHGDNALIADDVRAIEEQKRDEAVLDEIDPAQVAEIHKDEGLQ